MDFESFAIPRTRVVDRVAELLRICTDKKVLHLGCADVPCTLQRGEELLHYKLAKVTSPDKLFGLDISEEGITTLRELGYDNLIVGDVTKINTELSQLDLDVILAGEIIEHLTNPGLFLVSLMPIMKNKAELIITTPNATSIKAALRALFRRKERVHPDHNNYYSYCTLKHFLERLGFECKDIYFYQEGAERGLWRYLEVGFTIASKLSPACSDGLIVRARLSDSVDIESIVVQMN